MGTGPDKFLIRAENLTRIYRMGESGITGLRDVNLQIAEGSFVVLKGASGSGKSTLLSLLAGLDRPTSGRILVEGRDLAGSGNGRYDLPILQSDADLECAGKCLPPCIPGRSAGT